jgi:leader peptidase (prepilin peptidase)/N-methyltransferase
MQAASLGVALASVLIAITVTDLDRRVIPNPILIAGGIVAIAIVLATDPASLPERALWAAIASGFLMLGAIAHRDGMGIGDVKLAGLMGLYLGSAVAPALIVALAAGGVAGLAIVIREGAAAKDRAIPFGPFMALGGIVALCAGDASVAWYADSFLR